MNNFSRRTQFVVSCSLIPDPCFLSNPFSTKFWTPGVIPFQFADSDGSDQLEKFEELRQRHAIVQILGPHGSGKSTLLETLAKKFIRQGKSVRRLTLNNENRRLPKDFRPNQEDFNTVFFLDGYEQLSVWNRLRLRRRNWSASAGLIFTTHHRSWHVPILYETRPRFEVFRKIVDRLTQDSPQIVVDDRLLRELWEHHNGNMRNAFFSLYDLVFEYESAL